MNAIKEYLKNDVLLFDGGMGTYFSRKNKRAGAGCEAAVLSQPELILEIHREYLEAGAKAVKTNTFGANRLSLQDDDGEYTARIIGRACALAKQAAEESGAFVFADIGPISGLDEEQLLPEYLFVIDCFLQAGMTNFLFETHSSASCLKETAAYIRENCPEAYIIASFGVQADGYTREGFYGIKLCREIEESGLFDAAGFNCVTGARHMLHLMSGLASMQIPMLLMPNAGYPTVIGSRTFFNSDPDYFGEQLARMAANGAQILGGCCGTTPDYIRFAAEALQDIEVLPGRPQAAEEPKRSQAAPNHFWEKLGSGRKIIAVELDPPARDEGAKFLAGAKELANAGADAITIADCPIARARMDSSLLACKVHREIGIDVIPHMTCRDRNLNATKALLLGLCMEGVHNVLTITGDPVPTAERDEVKSVFQFNSRKLAAYISSLNETELTTPFRIYGALNLNVNNFAVQLRLAEEKVKRGICGFLTQPVLTEEAFENLKAARETLPAEVKILGGIIPVVSARNARFMNSEIAGINVDLRIADLMDGKSREECEELAVKISCEIADRIAPYADGFYLMTPFGRTGLMTGIIRHIREQLV